MTEEELWEAFVEHVVEQQLSMITNREKELSDIWTKTYNVFIISPFFRSERVFMDRTSYNYVTNFSQLPDSIWEALVEYNPEYAAIRVLYI